jgi:hypothetical protein
MAVLAVAPVVLTVCAGCGSPAASHPSPARPQTPPARPQTPPARPQTPPARPQAPPARPQTSPARPQASPDGGAPGPAWIITAGSLPRLAAAGLPAPVLDADFDQPGTLVLGRGRVDDFVPQASPAMVFTSETSLAEALNTGQVGPAVTWVLLDLEHWPLTPPGEQADPIGTLRTAIAVAHAHGKKVLFTPAVDLLSAVAPGTAAPARFTTFDRLIVGPGAAIADGFEVQSQQTEATPAAATFVSQAIATARAAHPGAPVLAGLSTNPDGRQVTAADLLAVYRAAQSAGATGFWLNIPQASPECPQCGTPQTPVAVAFLRAL